MRELFLPAITLDRASPVPLQRQIYRQIEQAIRADAMQSGTRLPSSRWLARLLSVSRNTVLGAYDELTAAGLIRGEGGAGMWVNGHHAGPGSLPRAIRESGFPLKTLSFNDPDGNPLYISF